MFLLDNGFYLFKKKIFKCIFSIFSLEKLVVVWGLIIKYVWDWKYWYESLCFLDFFLWYGFFFW